MCVRPCRPSMTTPLLNAFTAIGSRLWPLTVLDDFPRFFRAAALYVPGIPERASRVAEHIRWPSLQLVVEKLLGRLASSKEATALVEQLPIADGIELICDRCDCIVCGAKGSLATQHDLLKRTDRHWNPVQIFGEKGMVRGSLHQKTCTKCGTNHSSRMPPAAS